MARQLRVEYEGAIYHVMNRGDRREPIFVDDEDHDDGGLDREGTERRSSPDSLESVVGIRPKKR